MKRTLILAIALTMGLATLSHADVTIQMKTTMSGFMGMSNEGQDIQYVKNDRSFHDVTSKLSGGFMNALPGDKSSNNQQIIRIDKQLIWSLKPENKTYTEMTFDAFKQSMEQSVSAMQEMNQKPEEPEDIVWTVTVKAADKAEKIGSYNCSLITGKAVGVSKKNPKDTTTIVMNYWLASGVSGEQELRTFQQNYARAMKLDEMALQQGMASMMENYGDQFRKLGEEMAKTKGYPIKTVIEVYSSTTKTGSSEGMGQGDEGQAQSVADIMSKLGNKLGKKAAGKDDKKAKDENPNKIFSITTEVVSVSTAPIDDAKFEIPVGYKKQEMR